MVPLAAHEGAEVSWIYDVGEADFYSESGRPPNQWLLFDPVERRIYASMLPFDVEGGRRWHVDIPRGASGSDIVRWWKRKESFLEAIRDGVGITHDLLDEFEEALRIDQGAIACLVPPGRYLSAVNRVISTWEMAEILRWRGASSLLSYLDDLRPVGSLFEQRQAVSEWMAKQLRRLGGCSRSEPLSESESELLELLGEPSIGARAWPDPGDPMAEESFSDWGARPSDSDDGPCFLLAYRWEGGS